MFEQAPGFMAQLPGADHVIRSANAAYRTLAAQRDLVGKPYDLAALMAALAV